MGLMEEQGVYLQANLVGDTEKARLTDHLVHVHGLGEGQRSLLWSSCRRVETRQVDIRLN